MTDPYGVLGVSPSATDEEISKAYKKLAKRYHPDLNPGNRAAAEQMGRINQAYDQVKTMRQSGNRQNTQGPNNPTGDPFTYCYTAYRRYGSDDFTQSSEFRRRSSPFRMVTAVVLAYMLLRLVAALLGGTQAAQYWLYGDGSGSAEPPMSYYTTRIY